jgi:hypothetical protein
MAMSPKLTSGQEYVSVVTRSVVLALLADV